MNWRAKLWNPYIIVFVSSACSMTIELVASRLLAPQLGVSLYTWTSVIGVILAGMSLGNYLGGRMADRWASPPFLGLIYALGSVTTLAILWLINDVHALEFSNKLPLMVWVVGYIAVVFFVPSMVLGCVSPIVVKLSLLDLTRTGSTVGKIYAWSTVGSIVGTFATGFFLISWFGTKSIVLGVAGLLMLLAIWFITHADWKKALPGAILALAAFGGLLFYLYRTDHLKTDCACETNYFCIKVYEKEKDGRVIRELGLDRLVHSYTDMADPTHLVYGYEQVYRAVIAPLMAAKPDASALFIGGGGYTFPRYMEASYPKSRLTVIEIDPGVTETARQSLNLAPDTRIVTHNLDARLVMARDEQADSYDLIFGDAFNDFSVPYHLTTLEFDRLVDKLLRDDGLYVVNIVDGGRRGHFTRAYVRTLQEVFAYVSLIPFDPDWEDSLRTTVVVVASQRPHDLSALGDFTLLPQERLDAYLAKEKPLILTDDYVPVDNLLAPVFEDSHRG